MLNFSSPFSLGLESFENWWLSDDTATLLGVGEIVVTGDGQIASGALGICEGVITINGDGQVFSGIVGTGEGVVLVGGDGTIVLMSILYGEGQVSIVGDGVIAVVPQLTGEGCIEIAGDGGIAIVPQLIGDGILDATIAGDGVVSVVPQMTGEGQIQVVGDGVISVIPQLVGDGQIDALGDGLIYSGVRLDGGGTVDGTVVGVGEGLWGVTLAGSGTIDTTIAGSGVISIISQLVGTGIVDSTIIGDGTIFIIPQLAGNGTIGARIDGSGSGVWGVTLSGAGTVAAEFSADNAVISLRTDFFLLEANASLDVAFRGLGQGVRGVKIFDTEFDVPITTNKPEIAAGHYANGIPQPALPVTVEVCNSPLEDVLHKPSIGQLVKIIQDIPEELAVIPPVVTALPAYTGTTATIPLPPSATDIPTIITIGGSTYTLYGGEVTVTGGIPNIPANTFIYNPAPGGTPSITASLPPGSLPSVSAPVIIPPPVLLPTNYVAPPYPDLFTRFPVKGQFSWSLSFEGQPSASFNFVTYAQYRDIILVQLAENTEFTVFNVGYRVTSLSLKESMASTNPQRLIEVNVSLGGRHEVWIDRQVRLRGGGTQNSEATAGLDPVCLILSSPGGKGGSSSTLATETTLSTIANSARGAYCGPNSQVKIPASTPPNAATTFSSELRSRVRTMGNGSFVDYNNPGCVEVVGIDSVPQHFLSEGRLLSDVQTNIAGSMGPRSYTGGGAYIRPDGTTIPSTPLPFPIPSPIPENTSLYKWAKLYDPPYKLEWGDTTDSGDAAKSEDTQIGSEYTKPEWKQRQRVKSTLVEGDEPVNSPPAGSERLKDISVCFDLSGPRKTLKTTTTLDGLPFKEDIEEWGFVVYGWQLYNGYLASGIDATGLWQQIKATSTNYFYDPDTGYQLGYDTDGWELVRFKQESPNDPETAKYEGTTDKDERDLYNLHLFFQNPIRIKQRYYLEAMRDYYRDVDVSEQYNYKVCLPGGRSEWRFVVDPAFIEPYMVLFETTHSNNLAWKPAISVEGEREPLPLTCGKEEFHRRSIMIMNSKNTRFCEGFRVPGLQSALGLKSFAQESVFSLNSKENDRYQEFVGKFSSQDSQFVNSLQDTTFVTREGRPPVATRLPPKWEKVEPEDKNGKEDKVAAQKDKDTYDYFVQSGIDDFYGQERVLEGGSLSYPHAKSLGEALIGARTDATIDNWNGGTKENITIPFSTVYRPGDRLIYCCNYSVRQRRILSISNTINIDGFGGTTILTAPGAGTQVGVGIDRQFPMGDFRKIKKPENAQDPEKIVSRRMFLGGAPLGEILGEGIITRRNLP